MFRQGLSWVGTLFLAGAMMVSGCGKPRAAFTMAEDTRKVLADVQLGMNELKREDRRP